MYLVFDIGGTNIRLAVSQDGKSLDQTETIPTHKNFSEAMSAFGETALKLTKGQKIETAAGGVRALDMITKDRLVNHPTIPLWVGEPLKAELEKALGCSVWLENDAAMAGLGEAVFGAGQGKKIVAYITVSTGVGGVRIVEGKIDQSMTGFEPGNQIINIDPPAYLERYISGEGIRQRYGVKGENLSDPKAWDEITRLLAIGLNNSIVHWSPEIVILGGSIMNSISLDTVNLYLRQMLKIYSQLPEVVKASLTDKAGLLGSLAYLSQLTS